MLSGEGVLSSDRLAHSSVGCVPCCIGWILADNNCASSSACRAQIPEGPERTGWRDERALV